MKRNLTEDQIKARDERRSSFKAIAKKVADMPADERAALAARMPVVSVEGRAMSVHNCCMVTMQCPTATIVGGFRQWLKAGRCVRKGEHGLTIWFPRIAKDETGEATGAPDGFMLGTVFDVTQTDETAQQQAAA